MDSIFEDAHSRISQAMIEGLAPGGHWEGTSYVAQNPLRNNRHAHAFHFYQGDNGHWLFKDFADDSFSGDVIHFVALRDGISDLQAAEKIAGHKAEPSARPYSAQPAALASSAAGISGKKEKVKPAPIQDTPEALSALSTCAGGKWFTSRFGKLAATWKYRSPDGRILLAIVRFENVENGAVRKSVLPFFFGVDGKWHSGNPYAKHRPLFNLDRLAADKSSPVLVVEGEKCASVNVPGYITTTWPSGALSTARADWSPLEGRTVLVWPDADSPGLQAAAAVRRHLPQAQILDVQGKPDGWDIADAVQDGIDPAEFIRSCPRLAALPAAKTAAGFPAAGTLAESEPVSAAGAASSAGGDAGTVPPLPKFNPTDGYEDYFVPLGYDDINYYFLLTDGVQSVFCIPKGHFSASLVQTLAPLSFWAKAGMLSDRGCLRTAQAQDWIQGISNKAGRYDSSILRGAGVWCTERDGKKDFVINTGRGIAGRDGVFHGFRDVKPDARNGELYLSSDVRFEQMESAGATAKEGRELQALFDAQGWQKSSDSIAALGWSLISPFGSVLDWRPHIWVSGRRGSGKSWVLANLIEPLCGDFAYIGSGKNTEAGIRRTLRTDARPVILDEMESMDKRGSQRVTDILTLARNASCNASGNISIANTAGGVLNYRIRSCFCFASVGIPDAGAAVESRIIATELKKASAEEMKSKRKATQEHIGVLAGDAGKFRRRMFHHLPQILEDIAFLKKELQTSFCDSRLVDQWAPLLSAVWWLANDVPVSSEEGTEWLDRVCCQIVDDNGDSGAEEDEDKILNHVLSMTIENDQHQVRSVAEAVNIVAGNTDAYDPVNLGVFDGEVADRLKQQRIRDERDCAAALGRIGIRIDVPSGTMSIACSSDFIKAHLKDTPYESNYDIILKRQDDCLDAKRAVPVRFCGHVHKGRRFALNAIIDKYLGRVTADKEAA